MTRDNAVYRKVAEKDTRRVEIRIREPTRDRFSCNRSVVRTATKLPYLQPLSSETTLSKSGKESE